MFSFQMSNIQMQISFGMDTRAIHYFYVRLGTVTKWTSIYFDKTSTINGNLINRIDNLDTRNLYNLRCVIEINNLSIILFDSWKIIKNSAIVEEWVEQRVEPGSGQCRV